RFSRDWSSDVCSSDLPAGSPLQAPIDPEAAVFLDGAQIAGLSVKDADLLAGETARPLLHAANDGFHDAALVDLHGVSQAVGDHVAEAGEPHAARIVKGKGTYPRGRALQAQAQAIADHPLAAVLDGHGHGDDGAGQEHPIAGHGHLQGLAPLAKPLYKLMDLVDGV